MSLAANMIDLLREEIGLADTPDNPAQEDLRYGINKLTGRLATQYYLHQAGVEALNMLRDEPEEDRLRRESLRLDVATKKRQLGLLDDDELEDALNGPDWIEPGMKAGLTTAGLRAIPDAPAIQIFDQGREMRDYRNIFSNSKTGGSYANFARKLFTRGR